MYRLIENECLREKSLTHYLKNEMLKKTIKEKIHVELSKMNSSRDEAYLQKYIPFRDTDGFLIECERCGKLDDQDEGGEPYDFHVYYLRDGQEFDSCRIGLIIDERDVYKVDYLVDMYI